MHSSASFALSSVDEGMRTETSVEAAEVDSFKIDGEEISGGRAEGMKSVVESLKKKARFKGGLAVTSKNFNVKSGSSDSGAAALAASLDALLELDLEEAELIEAARVGSETAYRSILGGLSIYDVHSDSFKRIADPEEFRDLCIFGVPFNLPRFKADEIHQAVVGHEDYPLRRKEADGKIIDVSEALYEGDLLGVLEVMEFDARRAHTMFRDVGFNVIKPEMRKVCELAESLRAGGTPAYWNAAAGSIVYVFTLKDFEAEVEGALKKAGHDTLKLKVAGGVH